MTTFNQLSKSELVHRAEDLQALLIKECETKDKALKALDLIWPFVADSLAQVGHLCIQNGGFYKVNEALILMAQLKVPMPNSPYNKGAKIIKGH